MKIILLVIVVAFTSEALDPILEKSSPNLESSDKCLGLSKMWIFRKIGCFATQARDLDRKKMLPRVPIDKVVHPPIKAPRRNKKCFCTIILPLCRCI